jgi:hypothetical protein
MGVNHEPLCKVKSVKITLSNTHFVQITKSNPELVLLTYLEPVSTPNVLPNTFYNHCASTPWKTLSSIIQNVCLLVPYLAMNVLLLLSACVAGMCLLTHCLAMGIHLTIPCLITSSPVDGSVMVAYNRSPDLSPLELYL